jgi:ubiquinone/menaquinone biosynthesis C-methylase UbiE
MNNNDSGRKKLVATVFDRAAEGYGHLPYFLPLGRQLVELAQVAAGEHVLDVACGRGAVLFAAAEQVGPQGLVIGIDLSDGMVQETQADVTRRGLKNIQVRQMDAEALDFPDASFDAVLCGFGLFFFPRLEKALAEFKRVLKPGGRIAVSTWGDDDPRWEWYDHLLEEYQAIVRVRSHSLTKSEDLLTILTQDGFTNIQLSTQDHDWISPDAETWWAAQWSLSGRAGLEKLDAPTLSKFKTAVFQGIHALEQPDGVHYGLQAIFALAYKL